MVCGGGRPVGGGGGAGGNTPTLTEAGSLHKVRVSARSTNQLCLILR